MEIFQMHDHNDKARGFTDFDHTIFFDEDLEIADRVEGLFQQVRALIHYMLFYLWVLHTPKSSGSEIKISLNAGGKK